MATPLSLRGNMKPEEWKIMGKMTPLLTLDLSYQNLSQLPDELFELSELQALKLDRNKNIQLSEKIVRLNNLNLLSLNDCNLDAVPAAVMKLTQLETLIVSDNRNITLPDEMSSLVNLTTLVLDCNLHSLPPVVLKLSHLHTLDLSGNLQISLPDELCTLENIKVLRLRRCYMATVPPAVLKLTQLEELDLSGNSGTNLLEELDLSGNSGINLLEELDLSGNSGINLPEGLEGLTNIRVLGLCNCDLGTVPQAVLKLTQLEKLDLSENYRIHLPDGLSGLTNIRVLKLLGTGIATVPPDVWRQAQLEWLDLRSNPLQTLPAEVGQLTNVKHLDLSDCELRTLPPQVWRLTQLEWLDLRSNTLQTLPGEVEQLTNVKHLDLSQCQLRTLPTEVGRLTQLEWLNLRSNPLRTLPAKVGQLTNVKHLDLSYCQLRTLPTEVWRLTQLKWLDLCFNRLQTLPAEVGQLINVEHLDLSYCKLNILPPEVERLKQLKCLALSSNPLQALPAEVGQLTNIRHLALLNCQLRTLPPEVGRLTHLTWLDLSSNKLQMLPAEVAQLIDISHLKVNGNPLIKPPVEVCKQGITAIRQYFDELERSEEKVSSRLKVVVLGEKMAGKTSLVQTLRCGESTLTLYEDRTHCVEITQWAPDDNITFEVYDFGGHDVYHLTHQFFLTQDALNLLTVNLQTYSCTKQRYTEAVEFWLDTLNARVPGAVVTIVGSKTDMCSDIEIEKKTRDIHERFAQQHDVWQRNIERQIKKLENAKAAEEGADQGEVEQQLERTRQLLTRPLRLTGVCCVSSAGSTSGLDSLRRHILDTANDTALLFPILRRILPRTWVDFEQHLRDLRGDGAKKDDARTENNSQEQNRSEKKLQTGYDGDFSIRLHDSDSDISDSDNSDSSDSGDSDNLDSGDSDSSDSGDSDSSDSGDSDSWDIDHSDTLDVSPESVTHVWLTKDECLQQGQLAGLTADRLEPVLSYLQQVGTILRYTDIPELTDRVFHDPSGLIDVIKELFHHDLMKVFTNTNPRLKGFSNTKLKTIRKTLSRKGFLPREVAIALLGPHATPVGNVDVITNLVEHFGLCYAEWSDEQGGETSTPTGYYIPWYIREERTDTLNRGVQKKEETEFTVTCEIAHFCPRGLFERLSVAVNTLIKSRQDWKDVIVAVRESLPVIVYRKTKEEHVNIVVQLTFPVHLVQRSQVVQHVLHPLKHKLLVLLKEWPGLLYRLVYRRFDQKDKQLGEPRTPEASATIPTFRVGPGGCTVQHSGVTLEFPQGCVDETRFISVEVEAVPVNDDVRTNFTAMSAVLTVEQDFPQRFLRPVTVRLPWVWTQSRKEREETTEWTETVALHYNRYHRWTVFPTNIQEGPETIVFETDRFQSYVVTKIKDACNTIVKVWEGIWNGYCKDKVYLIVTPSRLLLSDGIIHLLCVHKQDDPSDFFSIGYVSPNHQIKQRISMTKKERIRAYLLPNDEIQIDPKDVPPDGIILEFPPANRSRYSFAVEKRENVPDKNVYKGHIGFDKLDEMGNVEEGSAEQINNLHIHLYSNIADLPESSTLHPEASPQPTESSPRTQWRLPTVPFWLMLAMMVVVVAVLYQFYPAVVGNTRVPGTGGGVLQKGFRPSKPAVLLVNDEYGTSKGGISTINRQLAKLLSSSGVRVLCTVLNATEEDMNDAKTDGVELLFPTSFKADKRQPTLDWLTWDHQTRYPNLPSDISYIIGHASITSSAASNIKEQRYPAAKLILFNHVIPEDTEHYKSESRELGIGEKSDAIRTDMDHADVIFSVGPNMYDYYRNQIRGSKPHYDFLPKPSDIFSQMNLTYVDTETKVVLSIGRVKGAERLKGYDLAAKAMGIVIGRFPKARWRVRGVSAEDFKESKKIIQANVENDKFLFTPLKYGTQVQLGTDMKEAHVVLMPSREEPFGLVGLEAISAGVPVLVSSNSGLAEFLESKGPEFDRPIVDMDGSDDEVAERLAKRIIKVLKGGPAEFQAAKRLKDKLLASKYWEESHRKFLEECGIPQ